MSTNTKHLKIRRLESAEFIALQLRKAGYTPPRYSQLKDLATKHNIASFMAPTDTVLRSKIQATIAEAMQRYIELGGRL